MFLALSAFESLSQTLDVIVGVEIGQFHHMGTLSLVHTLLEPLLLLLCQRVPVLSTADLSGNDGYLLDNERVCSQVSGHIHDG